MYQDLSREIFEDLQDFIEKNPRFSCDKHTINHWIHGKLKERKKIIAPNHIDLFFDQIRYNLLHLGPVTALLEDDEISEIMVNGFDRIFFEKSGKIYESDIVFLSENQLMQVIKKIVGSVGRRIDESVPCVDARLPDGSRIHAIIPPLSLSGATLTIRKFPAQVMTLDRLILLGSCSEDLAKFIKSSVKNKKNILISGGTGSGKTSLLNACASCINHSERIITIEDSAEILLDHPHVISLESRNENTEGKGEISIRDLLKNSLRMRPDRIIVGEIRGGEALDMLQAMNTGHDGSLTTIHANTALESLFRLETMVLMSGMELPISAIKVQVQQALDIVIQLSRLESGERKVIEVVEVIKNSGNFSGDYELKEIFKR